MNFIFHFRGTQFWLVIPYQYLPAGRVLTAATVSQAVNLLRKATGSD